MKLGWLGWLLLKLRIFQECFAAVSPRLDHAVWALVESTLEAFMGTQIESWRISRFIYAEVGQLQLRVRLATPMFSREVVTCSASIAKFGDRLGGFWVVRSAFAIGFAEDTRD